MTLNGNAEWARSSSGVEMRSYDIIARLAFGILLLASFSFRCHSKSKKPNDPLFAKQWYLNNQKNAGEDIRWLPVYSQGITGSGVKITIVGDGFDTGHPDLKTKIVEAGHVLPLQHAWSLQKIDPLIGIHGTPMAGLVAATCNNGIGICGVAPGAILLYNDLLLGNNDGKTGFQNLLKSIVYDAQFADISINSWGGEDFTGQYQSLDNHSSILWYHAMEKALKNGRNGKGTIFVWSGGNGTNSHHEIDNSNYDAMANFYGATAVCAVDKNGNRVNYSERGANLWICAPSSATASLTASEMISTRAQSSRQKYSPDLDYTQNFGGTSAAAALVGGVVALILEANPNLTWRDLKLILAQSARKNDPKESDWQINAAKYFVSHNYGFGVVDAESAIRLAKNWQYLPALKIYKSEKITGFNYNLVIKNSNIHFIEYIEIMAEHDHDNFHPNPMDASHTTITLISPSGIESILHESHECRKNLKKVPCIIPAKWRYGSARHLGENPEGEWRLTINENSRTENQKKTYTGFWSLKIFGH